MEVRWGSVLRGQRHGYLRLLNRWYPGGPEFNAHVLNAVIGPTGKRVNYSCVIFIRYVRIQSVLHGYLVM